MEVHAREHGATPRKCRKGHACPARDPLFDRDGGTQPLPQPATNGASLKDIARVAIETAEKQAIVAALRATDGNKQKAAQRLKTDYKTLFLKLKRYGLSNARQQSPSA
jgi:DNA-binding NtrC family response regulator